MAERPALSFSHVFTMVRRATARDVAMTGSSHLKFLVRTSIKSRSDPAGPIRGVVLPQALYGTQLGGFPSPELLNSGLRI
jgi:hypothetical protein